MTNTSERRTWWMLCCEGLPDYNYKHKQVALECMTREMDELVHVTELREGDIVLSRERLREAWNKCDFSLQVSVLCRDDLERELFGHK